MKRALMMLSLAALGALGAGCSKDAAPGPTGALTVDVAPLDLVGIRNACYTLVVTNQAGEVVWREQHLCADHFGDGVSAIAYVGTCDADTSGLPEGDLVNDNTVTLVLEDLWSADGTAPGDVVSEASYVNPCGIAGSHPLNAAAPSAVNDDGFGPCQRVTPCRENADSAVTFDVTVMRRAQQGFFDVAVSFEDLFCSAKLDCIGDPPGFVMYPEGHAHAGERGPSAVMAFACTSGTAGDGVTPQPTWLYLSDVVLTCDGAPAMAPLRLSLADIVRDGNQGPVGGSGGNAAIYEWSQYSGQEQVSTAIDKCFWNFGVGLDPVVLAGRNCTLAATGTASDSAFDGPAPYAPPSGHVWPLVTWSVQVTHANGALCANNALDDSGSGVRTGYYSDGGTVPKPAFSAVMRCGDDTPPPPPGCRNASDVSLGETDVQVGEDSVPSVAVTANGHTVTYPLPPGASFVDCCADACCH